MALGEVAKVLETIVREPLAGVTQVVAEVVVEVPDGKAEHEDGNAKEEAAANLGAALNGELADKPDRTEHGADHDCRKGDLVVHGVGKRHTDCQPCSYSLECPVV